MNVSEAMTAQVVTAGPTDSVQKVAGIMASIETGAVPIVEDDKVVGLITDRDIVLQVVAKGGALSTPASDVMSTDVQTCREGDNMADAAAQMAHHQIRRLVVVSDAGKLAGILSLGDIATDYGAKVVGKTLEEISVDNDA
ncbi:MAG: CBS domain-containing protein [Phenylobacterium sp.]|jgi:CBS domain-containing protein|uniref:CBS domain-containing protein n=1 Tax=Phenylobacterium sp. TaxID=1871053 RepID=UPI001B6284B9|nr:CBS domain-containing protein [Phenylobacterium sp.]MBP7651564.1 CBS domain-containing protein [Phenylobacterium sp.]MBP7816809.1 CBS domain-containing protein [Phenylobacterium sp.]MBP9232419.1 CBS domain-containing protein [Phenylobacterium sp.]MBP9755294.1 CBS domain-containing protein [Phenylobacterium sp.]